VAQNEFAFGLFLYTGWSGKEKKTKAVKLMYFGGSLDRGRLFYL